PSTSRTSRSWIPRASRPASASASTATRRSVSPRRRARFSMADTDTTYEPRLKGDYRKRIRAAMKEQFGYTNEMQIPKLDKIVLNMGIGEAVNDSKKVQAAMKDLTAIAGQKPASTRARKSIAGFKLRENMV